MAVVRCLHSHIVRKERERDEHLQQLCVGRFLLVGVNANQRVSPKNASTGSLTDRDGGALDAVVRLVRLDHEENAGEDAKPEHTHLDGVRPEVLLGHVPQTKPPT